MAATQDETLPAQGSRTPILKPTWRACLAIDAVTALTAALAVSPVMTIVDRGVIEAAAGHTTLMGSMRSTLSCLLLNPRQFMLNRAFGTMLLLYSGTYLTANCFDTLASSREGLPPSTTSSSLTKLSAITSVNMVLSLYKDSTYARIFGVASLRSKSLPAASFAHFIARDSITLWATFNAPTMIAESLPVEWESHVSRLSVAQIVAPSASQFIATPLHLLGLDVYYRATKIHWSDRIRHMRSMWLSTSLARACRIIPAYGVGGVVNNNVRANLMHMLEP